MKKIWSILIVVILMLSVTQAANAEWRGRGWGYRGGWGYGYRPYVAQIPVPAPCYRPYYTTAPVFEQRWIQPHYRRSPYGDQFIPGHWARVRVY